MTEDKKKKVRAFCFTINNWEDEDLERLKRLKSVKYLIVGDEVAPNTGTKHLQGYVLFKNPRSTNMKSLKKAFGQKTHIEICKGDLSSNVKYCSKDKIIYEYGERPKGQGTRTDLHQIKNLIKNGTKVDDLLQENPYLYHQYGRTLSKLEDVTLRKRFRTWETKGEWIYGETGTGKSHYAFKDFNPETHYRWIDDNGWWDGYTGQEIIIIDEFRGQIPYNILLQLIDKYPFSVKRRCREPIPILAKKVIITSSMHPEDVYSNLSLSDSLQQLERRCKIIELTEQYINST